MSKNWQSVLLKDSTYEELKDLGINVQWVSLDTHDQKVAHLIWFYKNNINNK